MIYNCIHTVAQQKGYFEIYSPIIIPILAFGLGLLAFRLNESWKEGERLRRIKECIIAHLRESILPDLPKLSQSYELCKSKVGKFEISQEKIFVFEAFNDDLYRAHTPSDYYKIFYSSKDNKFNKLIEIYSTIKFLSSSLPLNIHDRYIKEVGGHLEIHTKPNETRQHHFSYCAECKSLIERFSRLYDMRKEEVEKLEKAIKEFIF